MKQNGKKRAGIRIGRLLLLSVAAIILGLSVYNWNAKNLTGNQLPMPFGYGMAVVLSGSMEPRLSVDDLVIVQKAESVKVDDIVVFQDGKSLVIHRVMEVNGDEILTKGDANSAADAPISLKAVQGVLVYDIPHVGLVVNVLKQPVVIVVLLVLAIFFAERSFRKEKAKDDDELNDIKKEIESLIKEIKDGQ